MRKNMNSPRQNKTKFVVGGIIAIIVIGIAIAVSMGGSEEGVSRLSIDTSKGSPTLGSDTAQVTIVEFGDYQCPFCRKWNLETKPLVEKNYIDTGKARLIYVDFPIVGPDSIKAHAGSYCAAEQGLYWQYHDFLYANQGHENSGWTSANNLKTLVSGINGLDQNLFSQCIDSGKYEDRVKENKNIATKNGARSTPSFIIIGPDGNVVPIAGAQPYSTFQKTIDEMLT